jgi:hypothetical protein
MDLTIVWPADIETLAALRRGFDLMAKEADHRIRSAVGDARDAGVSWQKIADSLGVSKQAAQQRFSTML